MAITKLVLLRHGESEWNLENRFTGWTDVGLSAKGKREARAAGRLLVKEGYDFDLTFTSYLKRAILTLDLALEVIVWRRSYDVPPPPLSQDDPRHPRFDPRYRDLAPDLIPATESLADVVVRMLPFWYDFIVPALRAGRRVLVSAHGNSLRALVKHLDGISDEEIPGLNIPTGIPLVYELDPNLVPTARYYLGNPEKAAAAARAVAEQASRSG
jgi:2,3-bisphosphoglycerate-dependent phosphoglycerate mutase